MKEIIWKMPFEISQEVWTISKNYWNKKWYTEDGSSEFCGVTKFILNKTQEKILYAVLYHEENGEYDNGYELTDCFGNIEEAQEECDRRNNEEC